jgi:hypothetical protein
MIKSESQADAARQFWGWFSTHALKLKSLYSNNRLEDLAVEMNGALDTIEPQLAWEIGPGKKEPFMLTISGEGNAKLRQIANLIVDLAPVLSGWEFYSARPPRPAPGSVQLPESGERFETSEWAFVPIERPEGGGLDLIVVDDSLAQANREPALRAVSIYLDQVLGEDTVETWIGRFSVESRLSAHGKKSYKMNELPDYLLWITHRETNPLRKLGDQVH